ncbi:MAG: hypothetical protein FIB07_00425 [Candidatus Methanoperedens sp.]|nr:hypothetical protein [Candidatus Methanoperedens sp.]
MEKRIKDRLKLIGSLTVMGLLLAGIGSALGAGTVLQEKPVVFRAVVDQNGSVVIDRDGKVVQTFIMPEVPEGEVRTWSISDRRTNYIIGVHNLTKEEIEEVQAKDELERNKLLDIAKRDSRFQELIAGKDYKMSGIGQAGTGNKIDTKIITFEIEGKYYKVTIDMNSETVKSVEQSSEPKVSDIGVWDRSIESLDQDTAK